MSKIKELLDECECEGAQCPLCDPAWDFCPFCGDWFHEDDLPRHEMVCDGPDANPS
jgi:hypothetical protein